MPSLYSCVEIIPLASTVLEILYVQLRTDRTGRIFTNQSPTSFAVDLVHLHRNSHFRSLSALPANGHKCSFTATKMSLAFGVLACIFFFFSGLCRGKRPWWPIQSPSIGRKKKANG